MGSVYPPLLSRVLRDLPPLIRREPRGPGPTALQSAKPPECDGGWILVRLIVSRSFRLIPHGIGFNQGGKLVNVGRSLRARAVWHESVSSMKKAGLLGLGCIVWIILFLILLGIAAALSGGGRGGAKNSGQIIFYVTLAGFILYVFRVLRS